jgi:hypothetical protein
MTGILEKKHAILVTEFDRYVIEHPEFAAEIPPNAQIVLQVEGDDEYNEWSRQLAKRQRERRQPAIYVKVKGLKPAKSRLIKPELAISL